jgi:hypothetical protein
MGADKDFILRGGRNNLQDSLTDVSRLEKMFFDLKSPSGLFFITKQQLLSRNAVRTQTSGGLLNDGVYSPLNTLAQAAGNSNGLHLKKQGLNPFEGTGAYSPSKKLYQNAEGVKLIAGQNNTYENRLFTLYQSTNQNDSLIGFPSSISPLSTTQKTFWKKLGFTFNIYGLLRESVPFFNANFKTSGEILLSTACSLSLFSDSLSYSDPTFNGISTILLVNSASDTLFIEYVYAVVGIWCLYISILLLVLSAIKSNSKVCHSCDNCM